MRYFTSFFILAISLLFCSQMAWSDEKIVDVNSPEFKAKLKEELSSSLQKLHKKPMANFMEELLEKEAKIAEISNKLELREKELLHNEDNLKTKIADFEKLQEKLISCMDENDKAEKNRVTNLVEIISNMRPDSAASILSVQEPGIAVKIVSLLPPDKSAKIFNLMDKEISARLQKQYMNMKR